MSQMACGARVHKRSASLKELDIRELDIRYYYVKERYCSKVRRD